MSDINHFAISSILNSEIVGRARFGHGQIASQGDAQKVFDMLNPSKPGAPDYHKGDVIVPCGGRGMGRAPFLAQFEPVVEGGVYWLYCAADATNFRKATAADVLLWLEDQQQELERVQGRIALGQAMLALTGGESDA